MSAPITPTSPRAYWARLTDDTGILQHGKYGVPDRLHGYTTDDNARALIASLMWYRRDRDPIAIDRVAQSLAFLYHAQEDDGTFRNFMGYDRRFFQEKGSEDSHGRALWAIGYTLAQPSVPAGLRNLAWEMLQRSLNQTRTLGSPRARAYALIGLSDIAEAADWRTAPPVGGMNTAGVVPEVLGELAAGLDAQYRANRSHQWRWFEDSLTYGNAVLPWALFRASQVGGDAAWLATASESLEFLAALTLTRDGIFQPIGTRGWLSRGGAPARFDQQPLEACEMLLACREAFRSLGESIHRQRAEACYSWYLGRNSEGLSLIDPDTGACYDGLTPAGVNLNQGAESLLSFLIASFVHDEDERSATPVTAEAADRFPPPRRPPDDVHALRRRSP